MSSLESWKIVRDRSRCERPGCPLATATEFFAVMELPECVRRDLCALCFERLGAAELSRSVYWKARPRTDGKKEPTLDLQSLRVLFDRLGELAEEAAGGVVEAGADSPVVESSADESSAEDADEADAPEDEAEQAVQRIARARELRYFVALLLLRKRQLKMVDPKTEEQERADLVVIDPKADQPEPVALFAPELDEARLANLEEELLEVLGETAED